MSATPLNLIRRFGLQGLLIAMLCACGGGSNKPSGEYTGPVEGHVAESDRKAICQSWDAAISRVDDEAEIAFPNASSGNSVVAEWKKNRLILHALAIADKHQITPAQWRNIINEGKHKGWTEGKFILGPVDTDSSRAFAEKEANESKAKEDKERKAKEEQAAKMAEEKRLAERTPQQKAKDEADRLAKAKLQAEAERLEAERLAKEKAIKDEAERQAKKVRDELEADRLLAKVTSRVQLVEIVEKYPDTAAAKKARERLAKLDKK